MSPKSIETKYKGVLFRSRLEARWAVFFDTLEEPWAYEWEPYNLEDFGPYLPDFWLPRQKLWVEIKGEQASDETWWKLGALSQLNPQHRAALLQGVMPLPEVGQSMSDVVGRELEEDHVREWAWCLIDAAGIDEDGNVEVMGDTPYFWCECPECGSIDLQWFGYSDRNYCSCVIPRNHEGP
jgi:hypothetical protein